MASLRCLSWLCFGHQSRQTLTNRSRVLVSPTSLLVQTRGNKKQAKKQKKSKKEMQRDMMRDHFKKVEMEKLKLAAALKAAKKGEPLDPEMLNPARKRGKVSVSEEEEERRFLLVKEWSRYKMEQHKLELQHLQALMRSRDKALRELKKISLPLYNKALELNTTLFPFKCQPLTHTPPLPTYSPPDPDA